MLDFITREVFEEHANIDMREVIGQRDHYAGQTWLNAAIDPQYKEGKMRDTFRLYETNPDYYFSGEVSNGISFSSLNGGTWYSDGGGNHRTVVAKFACDRVYEQTGVYPLVNNVSKHYYHVDIEAWTLFSRLRALVDKGIHVSVNRVKQLEYKAGGCHTTEYIPRFHISDFRFNHRGRAEFLDASEFCKYAHHVLKSDAALTRYDKALHYWHFWFGDSNKLIYI